MRLDGVKFNLSIFLKKIWPRASARHLCMFCSWINELDQLDAPGAHVHHVRRILQTHTAFVCRPALPAAIRQELLADYERRHCAIRPKQVMLAPAARCNLKMITSQQCALRTSARRLGPKATCQSKMLPYRYKYKSDCYCENRPGSEGILWGWLGGAQEAIAAVDRDVADCWPCTQQGKRTAWYGRKHSLQTRSLRASRPSWSFALPYRNHSETGVAKVTCTRPGSKKGLGETSRSSR